MADSLCHRSFFSCKDNNTLNVRNQSKSINHGGTKKGAERFMAKWIAADNKARAGLRHAVCPNVMGRINERIAQSKRPRRAGSLAIDD